MRVAFYTNVTADFSLPVLEKLLESQHANFVHTYFYDTVAETRQSPLKILREFGVKGILQKVGSMLCKKRQAFMVRSPLRKAMTAIPSNVTQQ